MKRKILRELPYIYNLKDPNPEIQRTDLWVTKNKGLGWVKQEEGDKRCKLPVRR